MRYLVALLLLAGPVFGQDISVSGDGVRVVKVDKVIVIKEDATVAQSFPVYFEAPKGGILYAWSVPQGVTFTKASNKLTVNSAPKGLLTVGVDWAIIDFDKKTIDSKSATASVTVGDVPNPKPDPKPDSSAPIPLAGYRVLFIEESADRAQLTIDQFNAMRGAAAVTWLDANTVKEGNQPGWRVADKDAGFTSEVGQHWRDALKRPRLSVPWVIISNGVTGFEGPLPKTKSEIDALLQKYVIK